MAVRSYVLCTLARMAGDALSGFARATVRALHRPGLEWGKIALACVAMPFIMAAVVMAVCVPGIAGWIMLRGLDEKNGGRLAQSRRRRIVWGALVTLPPLAFLLWQCVVSGPDLGAFDHVALLAIAMMATSSVSAVLMSTLYLIWLGVEDLSGAVANAYRAARTRCMAEAA